MRRHFFQNPGRCGRPSAPAVTPRLRRFTSLALKLFAAFTLTTQASSFDAGWRFLRADVADAATPQFDDSAWESATLPHTARVEALVAGKQNPQWQGICWYRKSFPLPADAADKVVILRFEGAMNVASVWVNGERAGDFMGGYLAYVMDISKLVRPGATNLIAVRLDNRDNPVTGPKPLADLDFNLYGGLYRGAQLILKDKLHITDPILADKVAGGGVFVTFPEVTPDAATVSIKTHVRNAAAKPRGFALNSTLLDASGRSVAAVATAGESVPAGGDQEVVQQMRIAKPKLWSPQAPYRYRLRSELISDGRVIDSEETHLGIRRIEITADSFRINGQKMFLRGANRHQEYPYIGNALSDAAQYRDARKIKEAGFDYVRLSHYPQSSAFLDACDELGLVVMNCLMGWQYFGKDPAFAALKYQETRQLIRRDRNHPCVILWEVSLNESAMPKSFIEKTHAIAHEEYPGDQMFTCGWTKGYDVFLQARQHGGCKGVKDQPCVVSEYGDWEYFAQNAGLEQHQWKNLQPAERNSRQLRGEGEVRLLQQALNFQEAHNDNLNTPAFADGIWVMFDYNRGYAPDIEASGVMDIFRLPKFGYWFFRSQRSPEELIAGQPIGPVVFIANYWTPDSPRDVRVFSNCEEVALHLNGKLIARQQPAATRAATHLKHAPFSFHVDQFESGVLQAVGYRDGKAVATHERRTPGRPEKLVLRLEASGRAFAAAGADTVFGHADLLDANGTIVPVGEYSVVFGVAGQARLVGQNPVALEAGVATALVQSDVANPRDTIFALTLISDGDKVRILSARAATDSAKPASFSVHYTTDGTEPTATSAKYRQPLPSSANVRAAIVVKGKVVARTNPTAVVATTRAFR